MNIRTYVHGKLCIHTYIHVRTHVHTVLTNADKNQMYICMYVHTEVTNSATTHTHSCRNLRRYLSSIFEIVITITSDVHKQ